METVGVPEGGMSHAISCSGLGVRYRVQTTRGPGLTRLFVKARKKRIWGIRDVDLDVRRGEVVGLIGRNGSGKTTLLRSMAGIYKPDEGSIAVKGRIGALLSPTAGLVPELNGWENISLIGVLMGASRSQIQTKYDWIAEFSGLEGWLDASVRTYSSGMRARLGFSVAAAIEPDVMLIDEVITTGDEDFRERSMQKVSELIRSGRTAVMSSHNLRSLSRLCDRTVWLDEGSLRMVGEPEEVLESYLGHGAHR